MKKRVAILQSNYIPWKGYFDLIKSVDEFIIFDDVQYTRRDWRNRNKIKTSHGVKWLTIPVKVSGKYYQKIKEVEVENNSWADIHWQTLVNCYSKTRFFKEFKSFFETLYANAGAANLLCEVNLMFIRAICDLLNIKTKISRSMDYNIVEGQTERLVNLCKQAGGGEYLSGPSAKCYIDPKLFEDSKIALSFVDYVGYPEYTQLHAPFDHHVSVVDLIFNEGPNAYRYMKCIQ